MFDLVEILMKVRDNIIARHRSIYLISQTKHCRTAYIRRVANLERAANQGAIRSIR